MSPHKTVTINGRKYDAVTGMPVSDAPTNPTQKASAKAPEKASTVVRNKPPSGSVHSTLQRSKTLIRRATKKPAGKQSAALARPKPGRHMDFARSPKVSHFAPHPKPKEAAPKEVSDAPVRQHPTVTKALTNTPKRAPKTPPAKPATKPVTAKQVKEEAITKALKAPKAAPKKAKQSFWTNKWTRRIGIVAGLFILIGGTGYLIYQFVPSVSVSFAAAQADIDASYPEYTPDGFSLKQPVTYSDGQVHLTFASNSNDTTYTITQKRSTWDSTAVLDNIVKTAAGDDYTTTRERGLTIYTYDTNAAWVNSGILYTIDSNAALSGDQVRRIATSL